MNSLLPLIPGRTPVLSINQPVTEDPNGLPAPSAVKGQAHVIHNRVNFFPDIGVVEYAGSFINVTLDGKGEIKTDKKCTVTIDGVTTVIPAPAGHVQVADGKIRRNGKAYPPVVKVKTAKKKKKRTTRKPLKTIRKKPRA